MCCVFSTAGASLSRLSRTCIVEKVKCVRCGEQKAGASVVADVEPPVVESRSLSVVRDGVEPVCEAGVLARGCGKENVRGWSH